MANRGRQTEATGTRRDPSAPKGHPTPGRKQRNAQARARARRHRRNVRLWWTGLAIVVVGSLTALIMTGTG